MGDEHDRTREVARPYVTRQAQCGRRVVFSWRPADASPHRPPTTPWSHAKAPAPADGGGSDGGGEASA